MISVLTPTRGRTQGLVESVMSLTELAADPFAVEILLAVDPDDSPTWDVSHVALPAAAHGADVRWLRTPERYGYRNIHRYYNELAAMAAGDWLLLWNDDALMRTQGWDAVIEAQEPAVLWPSANHHRELNLFPVWPAAWSRAMGHVSLCFNADTWLGEVGDMAGRHERIPVEIFHDRDNVTGSGRFADATAAEGTLLSDQTCSVFRSAEMTAARERDAAIVRGLL
jgi:hypothetical protein